MHVRIRSDAESGVLLLPMPSAFPIDEFGTKLYLRGDFPHYFITNGACGCGAIEKPLGGPGKLIPVRFVEDLLAVHAVDSVELVWWWGADGDKPRNPPREPVAWPNFLRLNDSHRLESGTAYLVHGKPTRADRSLVAWRKW